MSAATAVSSVSASSVPAAASTAWREVVPEGEDARFLRHAEKLREIQQASSRKAGAGRALHRKGTLGAQASFEILPDLPAELRVGLFAAPATYAAYVRFSNGSPVHQADRKPDVRGLAVKLVGVPGKKLIPGLEDASTQDFLAIQTPMTPFSHADDFVAAVWAARQPLLALPRFIGAFGLGRALVLGKKFAASIGGPIATLAQKRFFSALPIRYGSYAAKYAFLPTPTDGAAATAALGNDRDCFGKDLGARLARGPLTYDFAVQLFRDERRTPIEDGSVEWLESDAPFVRVGRLVIPQQDVTTGRGQQVTALVEKLSFDPWHALEAHRPLGNMMRARSHAYRLSTQDRKAAPEPDGSERFA